MKIKIREMDYEEVLKLPGFKTRKPQKPNLIFRTIIKTLCIPDLWKTHFTYNYIGMEKLGKKEPCLVLMNHSSFIDLEIAESVMYPRPLNIICTSDGFVGKEWLMRHIGCIPTNKFVTDVAMVKDMRYALKTLKSSVLMYPEASYSFDGTATPLPDTLGKCLKMLKVPVVMINTYGAFARDPLYNNLQVRKVKVSADVKYLLSPEQIEKLSVKELNECLRKEFTFDNFRWQQENDISIKEAFRADYLNRVLYKCPNCKDERSMEGKGIYLTCHACGKKYELTDRGFLKALNGKTEFSHIPDWYQWQREEVREEIETGTYFLDVEADIYMMVNMDCIYKVGSGRLQHNADGFSLSGCDGKLHYRQKTSLSYSLYSDYYWYEIGDMICIGDMKVLYYLFPKVSYDVAAKTRIAAEELYKLARASSK
ncbi:MAG: 1-acyl-sn-glycerol-3-phosphate acyltransferase [Lachnospiraceae bacterium]|nr:1-acyl-sn-glycerol-3-phosphate acyltransferase [Lachnospiraceae bacterium]